MTSPAGCGSLISPEEALEVSNAFLFTLYGSDLYSRWKQLKDDMRFVSERQFVSWLIDAAYRDKQAVSAQGDSDCEVGGEQGEEVCEWEHSDGEQLPVHTVGVYEDKPDPSVLQQQQHDGDEDVVVTTYYNDDVDDNTCTASPRPDGPVVSMMSSTYYPDPQQQPRPCTSGDGGGGGGGGSQPGTGLCSDTSVKRRYSCAYCGYSSHDRSYISKHEMSVHERRKTFPCPHCHYQCPRKDQLKQHLVYKHRYSSNITCNLCGKGFHANAPLRSHIKNCTGVVGVTTRTTHRHTVTGQLDMHTVKLLE